MGRQEKRDQEKESTIEEEAISEIRDVRSKDWVGVVALGVMEIVFLAVLLYLIFGDFYLRVFLWIFNAIEYIWSQVGVKI